MGVLVEGNIFGPRVKFSKQIINTKEGFKYFPDYIDSTINGVFTDKAGVESGKNIDRGSGIILNSSYKGTVTIQRESSTGQTNLYTKKLFGDIELINESGGFAEAAFQHEDIKYLYEHGDLPLTDDNRLFLRLGDLEYRISTVRKMLNVYDKDGNDVGDYSPELSVCYNGQIIQRNNLFNIVSSIASGGTIRLAGSDVAMIVLRIKNIDPTVVLQRKVAFGMDYYDATLNGYVNTSGEKSQSPSSFIYIPVFVQANTYTSTSGTKVLINGSGSNWYEANSDIKIKPLHQLVEKMKDEYTRGLFDTYGFVNEPYVTTTLSDYNSDAEPYFSNPVSFRPAGGVHLAWTYNPVNNIDTDDIIYNSLNARTSNPPTPEPGGDELADDPSTDYIPPESDGETEYVIPVSDEITGTPGATNAFGTSFANYIFKRWRYTESTTAGEYNIDVAQSFFNDANALATLNPIRDLFVFKNDYPQLKDLVSRVFYLPFEYDELVSQSGGLLLSTPYVQYVGPVLCGYNKSGTNWSISETRYYNQFRNRYIELDLGTKVIQKVFNNFLDYTTEYTLNLPYGAGQYDIEPSRLFSNGSSGTVKIKGYLDIDLGILILKVIVNKQLVYETSVNVACDISVGSYDGEIATKLIKLPMQVGMQFGRLISNPQGFIKSKIYSDDARDRELKERRVAVAEKNAETNKQHLDVMKERNEILIQQNKLIEGTIKKGGV